MKGFDVEIKLFALDSRLEGKGWGEIRRAISERFNIKPPTVRIMQKWEKELDREALNRALMARAKAKADTVKSEVLMRVAEGLLPRLWEAKDAGEDIEYAGWRYFFVILENTLGSEKLRRFISQYLAERKGQPDLAPGLSPGWTHGKETRAETEEGSQQ
jgi:hypothetical protein